MNQKRQQKAVALWNECVKHGSAPMSLFGIKKSGPNFIMGWVLNDVLPKLHEIAEKERLYHNRYLIDYWCLDYNRERGTEQFADQIDLKIGLIKSEQDPIDFAYERLQQIREYRKKKWVTDGKY